MAQILIKGAIPACPLCLDPFKHHVAVDSGNGYYYCPKPNCQIMLRDNDKYIGKWNDSKIEDVVFCFTCGTEMRFFCRQDGFMKSLCPRCGASIASDEEPEEMYGNSDPSTSLVLPNRHRRRAAKAKQVRKKQGDNR